MKSLLLVSALAVSSVRAELVDVQGIVKARLEKIGNDVKVRYRIDSPLAYCTIYCRDAEEQKAIFEDLRRMKSIALTASAPPGTICAVMVYDTDGFMAQQRTKITESTLLNSSKVVKGKVLQVVTGGLLVAEPDKPIMYVQDCGDLIDNEPFNSVVYSLGETFQYTGASGAVQTVANYTCNPEVAVRHWSTAIDLKAKQEVDKKTARP